MVKKIIYITVVYLIIFNMICCSETKDKNVYKIENSTLLINNKVKVDLKSQMEKILHILGNKYIEDFMPGYKVYKLTNYPLSFFVNNQTKRIESILFRFYDNEKNELINEIIITDFELKKDISFKDIKILLNKKNINYDLEELTNYYNFSVNNHKILSIKYMKNDLAGPRSVEIETDL